MIEKAVEALIGELKKMAAGQRQHGRPGRHDFREQRRDIGVIIAGDDKVGKDGVITVEEARRSKPRWTSGGMQFALPSPTSSPTPAHGSRAENPSSSFREEDQLDEGSPAGPEQVAPQPSAAHICGRHRGRGAGDAGRHQLRGTLQAQPSRRLARRSPQGHARGHRHAHRCKAITEDLGLKSRTSRWRIWQGKKITIDKDNTTIAEGAGTTAAMRAASNSLHPGRRHHVGLSGDQRSGSPGSAGVAVIKVAATETGEGKKARVETCTPRRRPSRKASCRRRALFARRRSCEPEAPGDQQIGVNIVARASRS